MATATTTAATSTKTTTATTTSATKKQLMSSCRKPIRVFEGIQDFHHFVSWKETFSVQVSQNF